MNRTGSEERSATAEVYEVKLRSIGRSSVQFLGFGLLLIGAYNLLVPRLGEFGAIPGYRWIAPQFVYVNGDAMTGAAIVSADLILIAVGAVLAYLST